MIRSRALRGGLTALLVMLAGSSCAGDPPQGTARLTAPAPAPVVEVRMADFRFEMKTQVPPGRVVFQMINTGRETHNLILIPLPEDLPPIEEQIRGAQRRLVEPYAGIYDREPGDTGTFAVNLMPGQRYAIICTVVGEDGEPHSKKGMVTEFRVAEPGAKR